MANKTTLSSTATVRQIETDEEERRLNDEAREFADKAKTIFDDNFPSLDDFLAGKSIDINGFPTFIDDDGSFCQVNGVSIARICETYGVTSHWEDADNPESILSENATPEEFMRKQVGYFIDDESPSNIWNNPSGLLISLGKKKVILVNGDINSEWDDGRSIYIEGKGGLTISPSCLLGLALDTTVEDEGFSKRLIKMFENGDLKLVDFRPDELIPIKAKKLLDLLEKYSFTSSHVIEYLKKNPNVRPMGCWPRGRQWHKPACALLEYRPQKGVIKYFLLGMDEDAYFGVELPRKPKDLDDAFQSLKPKPVIEAEAAGIVVRRQGEWYAVPVEWEGDINTEFPWEDVVVWGESDRDDTVNESYHDSRYDSVVLGLTGSNRLDADQGRHGIESTFWFVTKNGEFFALDPRVRHSNEDHVDMVCKGWFEFHRNLALASRTIMGDVD